MQCEHDIPLDCEFFNPSKAPDLPLPIGVGYRTNHGYQVYVGHYYVSPKRANEQEAVADAHTVLKTVRALQRQEVREPA